MFKQCQPVLSKRGGEMLNYLRGDKATIFMGSFFKYNAMVFQKIFTRQKTLTT